MARSESWDIAVPLAALLKQRGWSHARLAKEANLKREDVTRMLRTGKGAKVMRVGRVRAARISAALEVTPLDLGLPPEADDAEAASLAHRLAALETEVDIWKGLLLEGLTLLGLRVQPEASPGSRVLKQAARRRQAVGEG